METLAKSGASCMLLVALALAGCGASGGDQCSISNPGPCNTLPRVTSPNFSSWQQVPAGNTVSFLALANEVAYDVDTAAMTVSGIRTDATSTGSVVEFRYDGNRDLTRLAIEARHSSPTWDRNGGDLFTNLGAVGLPQLDAAVDASGRALALAANPYRSGFEYQSYGVWNVAAPGPTGALGAFSAGFFSPPGSQPRSGTATYAGSSVGVYIDPTGASFVATAAVRANADFAAGSMGFRSSNTAISADARTFNPAPRLDLNGALPIGRVGFDGRLRSADAALNGHVSGLFFGPEGREIGGTFALTGADVERYTGAYGARR
jgi:hypothetical protein